MKYFVFMITNITFTAVKKRFKIWDTLGKPDSSPNATNCTRIALIGNSESKYSFNISELPIFQPRFRLDATFRNLYKNRSVLLYV